MIALFLVKAGAPLSPEIVAAFVHEQDEAHKGVVAKVKNLLAGRTVSFHPHCLFW